ncbi:MAG: MotA/TolQ/ExbB proton channel family protein [Pontiellaceae bacterium]|nr:MotA/TolQ/ExbB proton channel family protein [Pontiellaceae bacterium]
MKKRILVLALLLMAGGVFAQTSADSGSAGATTEQTDGKKDQVEKKTLLSMFKTGGWAMYPLAGFSFFMVAMIIQNFIALRPKSLLHTEMMPELIDNMLGDKVKTSLIYCRKHPSMFTNVFGAGLERCMDVSGQYDFEKVKESVEEASLEQLSRLMKPIDYLSIIGASAPMLGLLGTVSGMIKAFDNMGDIGGADPTELAANIGEALITTATGLIIAIPAMFFFFYFKKGFQKTLATLGRNIGFLFDALESGKMPASYLTLEDLEKMDKE